MSSPKIVTLGGEQSGKTTLVKAIGRRQQGTESTLVVVDEAPDLAGASAAILVVAADDGPLARTRDDVKRANHARVPKVVVFLNKADMIAADDQELIDLVEMEVRELLTKHGYNGDNAVIIRGSALAASQGNAAALPAIDALLKALT